MEPRRCQSNNGAAVAYIKHQSGVWSLPLLCLATEVWLWAEVHLRSLRALYIPYLLTECTDHLSQGGREQTSGNCVSLSLGYGLVSGKQDRTCLNHQCAMWFSLSALDNPPLGVDVFAHRPWPRVFLYAFSSTHPPPPRFCFAFTVILFDTVLQVAYPPQLNWV